MATLLVDAPRSDARRVEMGMVIAERYRIERVLGRGSFGAVFAATHAGTGQPIALKILSGGEQDDELALRRFFQEARVTSGLRHPNTIRVFDFGQDDTGLVYLAMELLSGHTLRQALGNRKRKDQVFTEAEAVEAAVSITRSLSEAHAAGLVHRDLKPENVFIHELPGDEPIVKVLDFGIVKTRGSSLTDAGPGGSLGTPSFMSPEQANNMEVDGRSDLYSLGIMLYLMVSGSLPFMRETPLQTLVAHINDPAPDLRQFARTPVSEAFVQVVERALSKMAEDRFADAASMRAALHSVVGRPVGGFSSGAEGTPPTEGSDVHQTLPGGGWEVGTATAPGSTAAQEVAPIVDPPPIRRPAQRWWFVAGGLILIAAVALGAWSRNAANQAVVTAPLVSETRPPPAIVEASPAVADVPPAAPPEAAEVVPPTPRARAKANERVDPQRPTDRPGRSGRSAADRRGGRDAVHEHNPFSSGAKGP